MIFNSRRSTCTRHHFSEPPGWPAASGSRSPGRSRAKRLEPVASAAPPLSVSSCPSADQIIAQTNLPLSSSSCLNLPPTRLDTLLAVPVDVHPGHWYPAIARRNSTNQPTNQLASCDHARPPAARVPLNTRLSRAVFPPPKTLASFSGVVRTVAPAERRGCKPIQLQDYLSGGWGRVRSMVPRARRQYRPYSVLFTRRSM